MDFLELAHTRYSVRNFSDREVEQEKIDKILEAMRLAPTATNAQPQKIYMIRSEEALAKLRGATKMAYNAPLVFMFCYDIEEVYVDERETYFESYNTGEMDCSILCTHMMLEATELGLGTLWARGYDTQDLVDAFELPNDIVPVCLLDVGYPAEDAAPSERHESRKPLSETVIEL